MRKKLIIAEKPSQAREYSAAIGGFTRKDGYFENEKYFITWCFGHLVELETDNKYRRSGGWGKDYLPLIPQSFKYCIGRNNKKQTDSGKEKQLLLIKKLIDESEEIINATDADREGELIFLYVYNYLQCKLPYRRLWISSLTEKDIRKGFENLLNKNEVVNLGKSGYARAIADWLVGINGTQACTLQLGKGTLLTIGRVQTAILKIIIERFLKNRNHTKVYTYKIKASHNIDFPFFSETEVLESKAEAEYVLSGITDEHICKEVKKEKKKVLPPLLFSIDTLTVECNKKFGLSAQQTLDIAQSLYEKKLTSYPRTDTEYINFENFENLKKFITEYFKTYLNVDYTFEVDSPRSVNDKKLTGSHDAIVPTGEDSNYNILSSKEKDVFKLILRRCAESFAQNAEYLKGKYTFENNNTTFFSYTTKLLQSGFKQYSIFSKDEKEEEEEKTELNIKEGDIIAVLEKELREIESKPPKLYTEANLIPDLTNIGKFLKEENPKLLEELKDQIDLNNIQIGTQATRPAIIERLKKLGFIEMQKKNYIPTQKGLLFYDLIKDLKVSNIATTAIWERKLKEISEGNDDNIFYEEIKKYIQDIVNDIFNKKNSLDFSDIKSIGFCPKCSKGYIISGKKAFGCSDWKNGCDFTIPKEISSKILDEKQISELVNDKKTALIKGFKSKEDETFDAILELDKNFIIKINQQNKKTDKAVGNIKVCPKCFTGNIIAGNKAFGCSNWKKGCDFTIQKEISGKKIIEKQLVELIKNKKTRLIKGFKDENGEKFDASLELDENLKIQLNKNIDNKKIEISKICPKCSKGNIISGKKAFGCSDWKTGCNFTIPKEISGKSITEKQILELINNKKTKLIKGFKSENGEKFAASLELDENFKIKLI